MTKSLILSCILLLTAASNSSAQDFFKHFLRPDVGFDLYLYTLKDTFDGQSLTYDAPHLGITTGLNLPVFPLENEMAFGISPNLGISFGLKEDFYGNSQSLSIELPVYATFKYGTDATLKGSKGIIGAAVGIGYHYSLFLLGDESFTFGLPSVMAEINFGKRKSQIGLVKIRLTSALSTHEETLATVEKLTFDRWGLHLVFTPGY